MKVSTTSFQFNFIACFHQKKEKMISKTDERNKIQVNPIRFLFRKENQTSTDPSLTENQTWIGPNRIGNGQRLESLTSNESAIAKLILICCPILSVGRPVTRTWIANGTGKLISIRNASKPEIQTLNAILILTQSLTWTSIATLSETLASECRRGLTWTSLRTTTTRSFAACRRRRCRCRHCRSSTGCRRSRPTTTPSPSRRSFASASTTALPPLPSSASASRASSRPCCDASCRRRRRRRDPCVASTTT